jgi:hypothetical protein
LPLCDDYSHTEEAAWIAAASRLPASEEKEPAPKEPSVSKAIFAKREIGGWFPFMPASKKKQLFLDCDGVLADFDSYAEKIFGLPPRKAEELHGKKRFWADLQSHPDFYFNLPLMPGARELYEAVKHLNPIILTGLPLGDWAEPQKRRWAEKYFPGVRVICCASVDKRLHMKPGDVLVDDWPKYRHLWEEAGGVFILHRSVEESIDGLSQLFPIETAPKEGEKKHDFIPFRNGVCEQCGTERYSDKHWIIDLPPDEPAKVETVDALEDPPEGTWEDRTPEFRARVLAYEACFDDRELAVLAAVREDQLKASLLREKDKDEEIERLRGLLQMCSSHIGHHANEGAIEIMREIKAAVTGEQP